MKVLFAASEAVPFAKTGGLGDVVGSLPNELCRQGHDVRVVIPMYKQIKESCLDRLEFMGSKEVPLSWRSQYCGVFRTVEKGVTYYFIDNEQYFLRDGYYGYYDDAERFAFFSKAVLECLDLMDFQPQILHCHDWQAAMIPIYLRTIFAREGRFTDVKTLYTIHNIAYQGKFDMSILGDVLGLSDGDRGIIEMDGCLNFMKGGMETCDGLNTVSPTYANEIQYAFYAEGLERIVLRCSEKLTGILNGIDQERYAPDRFHEAVPAAYTADTLAEKAKNKRALQEAFGLEQRDDVPLFAMVSRLASHKGFSLLTHIFDEMMERPLQFALLGTGEAPLESFFQTQPNRYPGKAGVKICFSEDLAQLIYSGADFLLMPSTSEPCGLSQMIALRCGTIPIVRETGGLKDTVLPYRFDTKSGSGVTFANVNAHDLLFAVERGMTLFHSPSDWDLVRKNGMELDFSWEHAAQQYGNLYEGLVRAERRFF